MKRVSELGPQVAGSRLALGTGAMTAVPVGAGGPLASRRAVRRGARKHKAHERMPNLACLRATLCTHTLCVSAWDTRSDCAMDCARTPEARGPGPRRSRRGGHGTASPSSATRVTIPTACIHDTRDRDTRVSREPVARPSRETTMEQRTGRITYCICRKASRAHS